MSVERMTIPDVKTDENTTRRSVIDAGEVKKCSMQLYWHLKKIEDILGDNYDLDGLRELVEADRDGRCVVMPCKVGDSAYVIDKGDYQSGYMPYVREKEVTEISWKKTKYGKDIGLGIILKGGDCNTSARHKISSIGKTVFLTREAAEAALEGAQNG